MSEMKKHLSCSGSSVMTRSKAKQASLIIASEQSLADISKPLVASNIRITSVGDTSTDRRCSVSKGGTVQHNRVDINHTTAADNGISQTNTDTFQSQLRVDCTTKRKKPTFSSDLQHSQSVDRTVVEREEADSLSCCGDTSECKHKDVTQDSQNTSSVEYKDATDDSVVTLHTVQSTDICNYNKALPRYERVVSIEKAAEKLELIDSHAASDEYNDDANRCLWGAVLTCQMEERTSTSIEVNNELQILELENHELFRRECLSKQPQIIFDNSQDVVCHLTCITKESNVNGSESVADCCVWAKEEGDEEDVINLTQTHVRALSINQSCFNFVDNVQTGNINSDSAYVKVNCGSSEQDSNRIDEQDAANELRIRNKRNVADNQIVIKRPRKDCSSNIMCNIEQKTTQKSLLGRSASNEHLLVDRMSSIESNWSGNASVGYDRSSDDLTVHPYLTVFHRLPSGDDSATKPKAAEFNEMLTSVNKIDMQNSPMSMASEFSSRTALYFCQQKVEETGSNKCSASAACDFKDTMCNVLSFSTADHFTGREMSCRDSQATNNSAKLISDPTIKTETDKDRWLMNLLQEVVGNGYQSNTRKKVCNLESPDDIDKSKVGVNDCDGQSCYSKLDGHKCKSLVCDTYTGSGSSENHASLSLISMEAMPIETKTDENKEISGFVDSTASCTNKSSSGTEESNSVAEAKLDNNGNLECIWEPQLVKLSVCERSKIITVNVDDEQLFEKQHTNASHGDCLSMFEENINSFMNINPMDDPQTSPLQLKNHFFAKTEVEQNDLQLDKHKYQLLYSSLSDDYQSVFGEVGHRHSTRLVSEDNRYHSISPKEMDYAGLTDFEISDVNLAQLQQKAVVCDVPLQDVSMESLNSPVTTSPQLSEVVDQQSDESEYCITAPFQMECEFTDSDILLPASLFKWHDVDLKLDVLDIESSVGVDCNVTQPKPDLSKQVLHCEDEMELSYAPTLHVSAARQRDEVSSLPDYDHDVAAEMETMSTANEDNAALECALGLVSLAQAHETLYNSVECQQFVNSGLLDVEQTCFEGFQGFNKASHSVGIPDDACSALKTDQTSDLDSNINACHSCRSDSNSKAHDSDDLITSNGMNWCKESPQFAYDESGYVVNAELSTGTRLSSNEFTPWTFSITRAVQIVKELLDSFNSPTNICVSNAGFVSELPCPPPLKKRPSYVQLQAEASRFKRPPELIPKPVTSQSSCIENYQLDCSLKKHPVPEHVLANEVTIPVNNSLPVLQKKGSMLQNVWLDCSLRNSSPEQLLVDETVKPLNSDVPVLQIEVPELQASSILTCKEICSSLLVSSRSTRLRSKNRELPASEKVSTPDCRKTALGLRSNPTKFRPFQIELSRSSRDKELTEPDKEINKPIEQIIENCGTNMNKMQPIDIPCSSSTVICPSQLKRRGRPRCQPVVGEVKVAVSEQASLPRGSLVWARIGHQRWWPAMVINAVDCGKRLSKQNHCWVFWFGDHKISETSCTKVVPFALEYSNNYLARNDSKDFKLAMLEVVKEHAQLVGHKLPTSLEEALLWAEKGFIVDKRTSSPRGDRLVSEVPEWISTKLAKIRQLMLQSKNDSSETGSSESDEDSSNQNVVDMNVVLMKIRRGSLSIEDICISCGKQDGIELEQHPFFRGGLCEKCKIDLSAAIFVFEGDGISAYCLICNNGGQIFVCANLGCNKVYCTSCIRKFVGDDEVQLVLDTNPWHCYLCSPMKCTLKCLLEARLDWRENIVKLLGPPDAITLIPDQFSHRPRIRVLSLFDGIGTGRVVLCQLGIDLDAYFASEIDESSKLVTRVRHGDAIQQIGCVKGITRRTLQEMLPIDLLIGGSPCNDLSIANPNRQGLEGDTGCLFYEYCRILTSLQGMNPPERKLFWLFENVASMQRKTRDAISRHLNCQPAVWDAKHFSAMKRTRFFWGNLPNLYCPLQYNERVNTGSSCTLEKSLFPSRSAKDLITWEVHTECEQLLGGLSQSYIDEHIVYDHTDMTEMFNANPVTKIRTITTKMNSLMQAGTADDALPVLTQTGTADTLWIPEIERIFGFPEHYTDVANLSHCRRQKLLGQAWSIPVIRHLLSPLKQYFQSPLSISDQ